MSLSEKFSKIHNSFNKFSNMIDKYKNIIQKSKFLVNVQKFGDTKMAKNQPAAKSVANEEKTLRCEDWIAKKNLINFILEDER